MVKGLGCRKASQSHPRGNPQSACAKLWVFLIWRGRAPVARRGVWRSALAFWVPLVVHGSIGGDGADGIGALDHGPRGAWHEPFCRPATLRGSLNKRIMPGHGRRPGWWSCGGRAPWREGLDDHHGAAASATGQVSIWDSLFGRRFGRRRRPPPNMSLAWARLSLRVEPASGS